MDVRTIREKLGMTQVELAVALEVSLGSIRRWEYGLVKPRKWVKTRLQEIAKSKGVEL